MTLALAPLPAWLELDERRAERRTIAFDTTMMEGARREAITVRMTDISRFGCRLKLPSSTRVGRMVTLALPSAIAVEGAIAWTRDGRAGLDFSRPLPGMLIDRLISNHGMGVGT